MTNNLIKIRISILIAQKFVKISRKRIKFKLNKHITITKIIRMMKIIKNKLSKRKLKMINKFRKSIRKNMNKSQIQKLKKFIRNYRTKMITKA